MVVSMWLVKTRLRPWPAPGSVPITLGRSGMSATLFAANPWRVSQSYTYSPTGPSLPVGLSMLPRSRVTLTSSSTSILSRTLWARASMFMGNTPSAQRRAELGVRLVVLDHPLDVGAQPRQPRRGPGAEVDVGEEAARAAEDEDPPAHLDRLLELMRHEDRGVALRPREVDEGLAKRGRRDLVEVAEGLVGEKQHGLDGE